MLETGLFMCAASGCMMCVCVFFFKQKTAYEMRISDWSSDVCSSDLQGAQRARSFAAKLVDRGSAGLDAAEPQLSDYRGHVDPLYPANRHQFRAARLHVLPDPARRLFREWPGRTDRKSVVSGKSGSGRVVLGGCRNIKQKKKHKQNS